MRVRTDDEVYRVDAVWLGPPKATFPWRARYIAYGVGIAVWLAVFALQRKLGFEFGFFTLAWSIVITVVVTRLICTKINHERPFGAVLALGLAELQAPTAASKQSRHGSAASARRIRVSEHRPRPRRAKTATSQGDRRTDGA